MHTRRRSRQNFKSFTSSSSCSSCTSCKNSEPNGAHKNGIRKSYSKDNETPKLPVIKEHENVEVEEKGFKGFLKLDTKNHCLFCYKECAQADIRGGDNNGNANDGGAVIDSNAVPELVTSNSNANSTARCRKEISSRFIRLVTRYLKLNFLPKRSNNSTTECGTERKLEISVCGACYDIIDSFCQLYFKMQEIKMQLDWRLTKMRSVMKCADRVPSRLRDFHQKIFEGPNGMGEEEREIMQGFRKEFFRKSFPSAFPKVILPQCQKKDPRNNANLDNTSDSVIDQQLVQSPSNPRLEAQGSHQNGRSSKRKQSSKDVPVQSGQEIRLRSHGDVAAPIKRGRGRPPLNKGGFTKVSIIPSSPSSSASSIVTTTSSPRPASASAKSSSQFNLKRKTLNGSSSRGFKRYKRVTRSTPPKTSSEPEVIDLSDDDDQNEAVTVTSGDTTNNKTFQASMVAASFTQASTNGHGNLDGTSPSSPETISSPNTIEETSCSPSPQRIRLPTPSPQPETVDLNLRNLNHHEYDQINVPEPTPPPQAEQPPTMPFIDHQFQTPENFEVTIEPESSPFTLDPPPQQFTTMPDTTNVFQGNSHIFTMPIHHPPPLQPTIFMTRQQDPFMCPTFVDLNNHDEYFLVPPPSFNQPGSSNINFHFQPSHPTNNRFYNPPPSPHPRFQFDAFCSESNDNQDCHEVGVVHISEIEDEEEQVNDNTSMCDYNTNSSSNDGQFSNGNDNDTNASNNTCDAIDLEDDDDISVIVANLVSGNHQQSNSTSTNNTTPLGGVENVQTQNICI